jgi:hypothetical protein
MMYLDGRASSLVSKIYFLPFTIFNTKIAQSEIFETNVANAVTNQGGLIIVSKIFLLSQFLIPTKFLSRKIFEGG